MKKLISHILIALTGMLAVSCNAWLDVTPENAIADDDLFSTGFGYRNALNGIYTNLASDELYGKQLSWGFLSAISQQYNQKVPMGIGMICINCGVLFLDGGKLGTLFLDPLVSEPGALKMCIRDSG